VLPVAKTKVQAYRRIAQDAGKVWLEHGALSVTEHVADDAKSGVQTSFPQAVKLEAGEVVIVGLISFRSGRIETASMPLS
jgi:uncharacterized protein YbaA (DUF1428 family)